MGRLSAPVLLCVALAAAYLAVAAESKCVLDNASCKNHEGADQSACDLCKCTFENKPEKNEILAPATLCGCAYTACKKKCEEDAYVVHPLEIAKNVKNADEACLSACNKCECKPEQQEKQAKDGAAGAGAGSASPQALRRR